MKWFNTLENYLMLINSHMVNPLSAKFIKWSNTLKQIVGKLPTICLSVFDHFSGLAFKGLKVAAVTKTFLHCNFFGFRFTKYLLLLNLHESPPSLTQLCCNAFMLKTF